MVKFDMETKVWIYFSKTGTGYELKGDDIISGFDSFIHMDGTYLIEFSHSSILNDMNLFAYEWDNSQRKRKTVYENFKKKIILLGFMKNVELPQNVSNHISNTYDAEELELEASANS
jgi:hypothetical protein